MNRVVCSNFMIKFAESLREELKNNFRFTLHCWQKIFFKSLQQQKVNFANNNVEIQARTEATFHF